MWHPWFQVLVIVRQTVAVDWMVIRGGLLDWRVIVLGIILWYILLKRWERRGVLDKWNSTRALGAILMIRTTRGLKTLEKLSKPRKFWRIYGELSLWVCRISMVFVLILLLLSIVLAILFPPTAPPPSFSEMVAVPGLNPVIPLGWGILAFVVSLVIHEFGHGLQARAHGMRVKSFGLLLLGPLPLGAFAEPEYDELTRAPNRERQRIFAAGPATNIFTAIVCFLLLGAVATQFSSAIGGVHPQGIVEDSGAEKGGLQAWDIITQINGTNISNQEDFTKIMDNYGAGESVELTVIPYNGTSNETIITVLLTDKHEYYTDGGWDNDTLDYLGIIPGDGFLGVSGISDNTNGIDRMAGPLSTNSDVGIGGRLILLPIHTLTILVTPFDYKGNSIHPAEEEMLDAEGGIVGEIFGKTVLLFLFNLFFWLIWVNILLGFTNLIPMIPFDGGHMFRDIVHDSASKINRFGKRRGWWKIHPLKINQMISRTSGISSIMFLFILLFLILIQYVR